MSVVGFTNHKEEGKSLMYVGISVGGIILLLLILWALGVVG